MANHNNTPASVLNAPQPSFVRAYANDGRNRQNRRHFQPDTKSAVETPPTLRFKPMLPATMEPARVLMKVRRTGVKGRRRGH